MPIVDRRAFLAAAATLPFTGSTAVCAEERTLEVELPRGGTLPPDFEVPPGVRVVIKWYDPVFRAPPLSANRVAQKFHVPPAEVRFPDAVLSAFDGGHRFSELTGKVRLISLWAEWCTPCLFELPDLSSLQRHFGGEKFEVLAVLTASKRKLDLGGAAFFLSRHGAEGLRLWIEPGGGIAAIRTLATRGRTHSLPCNLLVDARGRIRGRAFGASAAAEVRPGISWRPLTEAERERRRAETTSGARHSYWASTEAAAFVKALIDGALG